MNENYEEIKIGKKTYIQRNEFSNFKVLDSNGKLKSIKNSLSYNGELEKIIQEALILKYNINKYFTTKINYNGDIVLTSFSNVDNLKNIIIPENIDGRKVIYMTDIFKDANIDRVFLPDTMTTLPVSCFERNEYISEIYLSKSLKEIPAQCFKRCSNLKKINLSNIETIGVEAFMLCSNLEEAYLKNARKIFPAAFYKCKKIKIVSVPNLIALGSESFAFCTNLKSVELSNDIEVINNSTFKNCTKLNKINTPRKLKTIKENAFEDCLELHKFDFKDGIETIKYNAFEYSGLEGILILPDTINKIESNAFVGCKLNSISIGSHTNYSPTAFGMYNIDKIITRKEVSQTKDILER